MATVTIRIPAVLQPFAGGQAELAAEATTVEEALAAVCSRHEQLRPRLFEPEGRLRRFVNVFVGESRISQADGLATPVRAGDVITILPAVAGG
ncbi:MAG TPA: MoaD/ThiS family protein [Steroidobacteraceae bacterium]|nr:MoaD/ThiS family protein [Steroidobacteraceae bacterium]